MPRVQTLARSSEPYAEATAASAPWRSDGEEQPDIAGLFLVSTAAIPNTPHRDKNGKGAHARGRRMAREVLGLRWGVTSVTGSWGAAEG